MLSKTLKLVAIGAIVASTLGIAVLAAAFAVFASLKDLVGPGGAAAVVAGLFALIAALVAVFGLQSDRPQKGRQAPPADAYPAFDFSSLGLVEKVTELARERPLAAVGAAVAVGLVAWRNPELVTLLARSFLPPARTTDDRE
jgi:hypothetical protein